MSSVNLRLLLAGFSELAGTSSRKVLHGCDMYRKRQFLYILERTCIKKGVLCTSPRRLISDVHSKPQLPMQKPTLTGLTGLKRRAGPALQEQLF